MPKIDVQFFKRDFSTRLAMPDVELEVQRYSHHATGGPEHARIVATSGDFLELWQLTRFLRTPVEIYDDQGVTLWWGFVKDVRFSTDLYEITLTLDNMANNVDVAYTVRASGTGSAGSKLKTGTTTDQESIDEFGTKELIETLSDTDTATAQGFRDLILDRHKFPIPAIQIREGRALGVEILCAGWWSTLEWRYYTEASSSETNTIQNATQPFGTNAVPFVAQSFDVTANQDWLLNLAIAMVGKSGSPTDNIVFGIYTDSSNAPGTLIQSGTLANADITGFVTWPPLVSLSEVAGLNLANGSTYWLRLSRSGALDDSNYFLVGVDSELSYTDGSLLLWNGSAWVARDTDADMAFDVSGVRDTDVQLSTLLTDKGQFFVGHEVEVTGLVMPARVEGDFTALERARELLECGNSAGKRYTVEVMPERFVKIAAEPESGTNNLLLRSDGNIENRFGIEIPKHQIHRIVRQWITPKDLPTVLGNIVRFADFGNMFVDQIEYDTGRERFRIRTRETVDLFKVARLEAV